MRIRVFYCGRPENAMNIVERSSVSVVYASFCETRCVVEPFDGIEALTPVLLRSLREDEVSAVYVSPELYLDLKLSVYETLELSTDVSRDILALLPPSLPEEEKRRYALFASATVMFPSEDGVNTAFCTATGSGNFMLIPISPECVALTESRIADWFARKAVIAPTPDEPQVKLCRDAAGALFERHLTVGCANTATTEYLRNPTIACGEKYAACFKFVDVKPDEQDLKPRELTASYASRAAWEENTALGCAMSNVYKIEKDGAVQYLVYIAVSVDNDAAVSRVVSRGEEMAAFLKRAAKELFSLIVCTVTDQPGKPENVDFEVF
ncbi:MAG: hypothetical protein IJL26_03085 [Clostridia bacterium]|nr:hypothetical protein [Clostridia bacterium]